MRLIITGGGTGGHIIPNIALVEAIRLKHKDEFEILYLGSHAPLEKELCSKSDIPFRAISTGKLRRYFSFKNITDLARFPLGILQALKIILKFKPALIWSKGGFVSVPVVFAAFLARRPVIIHESDVIPGLSTRLCAPLAKKICLGWDESKKYFKNKNKLIVTGIPLKQELTKGKKDLAISKFKLEHKKPLILIMGGSTGATHINKIVTDTLDQLLPKFQIIHICGAGKLTNLQPREGYQPFEYIHEQIYDLYTAADIVISRAGANSIAELEALNKKTILIPLPLSASRGDQIINAQIAAQKSNNFVNLPQEKLTAGKLVATIDKLFNSAQVKQNPQTNLHLQAAEKIISIIQHENRN